MIRAGGTDGVDVISRFFAPWAGISEDPVTGSAHAVLGPYYSNIIQRKILIARQCSLRGGSLLVNVQASEGRVLVSGAANIMIRGSFSAPSGIY